MRHVPSRRTWAALAALVVVVGLALGPGIAGAAIGTAGAGAGGSSAPTEPSPGASTPSGGGAWSTGEVEAAATHLFAVRSDALARRDRAAWESTVADPASEAGGRQMSAYDALVALGVTERTARDVQVSPSSGGSSGGPDDSSVTVTTRVAHQIPGYDRAPREAARTVTLEATSAGWRVASDGAAQDQLQLWDLPGLQVVRSATSLVAGDVPREVLAERLADADAATGRLTALFGATTPSVIVVPATAAEGARQLGRPEASGAGQVAATTDGQTGPLGTAAADRVVLDPDAFARLTDEGRREVVAHELTHVATRATTAGQLPLWLSEGFAEYVGWGPVTMPVRTAAARLLSQVRSGGAPQSLPAAADFDSSRGDLATAYQGSWLAVRLIAADHGEPALMVFYRAVAGTPGGTGTPVGDAFRAVLGTSQDGFVARWRAELQALAQ